MVEQFGLCELVVFRRVGGLETCLRRQIAAICCIPPCRRLRNAMAINAMPSGGIPPCRRLRKPSGLGSSQVLPYSAV